MSDVFNKEKRSEIMRKVRGKRNKPTELHYLTHQALKGGDVIIP